MRVLLNQAGADTDQGIGWDTKLSNIGTSWDELGAPYRAALTSLAYNVGVAPQDVSGLLFLQLPKMRT